MAVITTKASTTNTSSSRKRQAGPDLGADKAGSENAAADHRTRALKDFTFTNLPTSSINDLCTLSLKTSKAVQNDSSSSSSPKTELAYPIQFTIPIRSRPRGVSANKNVLKVSTTTKIESADHKENDTDDCPLSPTLEKELFGSLSPIVFKGAEEVEMADECAVEDDDDDVEMSTKPRTAFSRVAADVAAMSPPKLPVPKTKAAFQRHQRNKSSSVTGFRETNNAKKFREKTMRMPEYHAGKQDWNPSLKHTWAAERARRPSIAQTPSCVANGNSFEPSTTADRGRTERRDSNVSMQDVSCVRSKSQIHGRRKSLRETLGLVGVCHPLGSPANFDSVMMPPPPLPAKKPAHRPRRC